MLIGFIDAENISVDFPQDAGMNEEFEVKIKLINFSEGIYDVKIDLLASEERVAKILNGGVWKSTFYYVNDVITNSEEKEFQLKIIKEFDKATIEIKLKNSEENTKAFSGYEIEFDNSLIEDETQVENETEISESTEEPEEETLVEDEEKMETAEKEEVNYTEIKDAETYLIKEEQEIINLAPITLNTANSKSIKSGENKEILKRNLSFYGIITFCVIFGAWFLLTKGRRKNEFRE